LFVKLLPGPFTGSSQLHKATDWTDHHPFGHEKLQPCNEMPIAKPLKVRLCSTAEPAYGRWLAVAVTAMKMLQTTGPQKFS
jgi:hypothetical protein